MNKQEILRAIAASVIRKHPWRISQEKYTAVFGELPKEFLEERLAYDNLVEKAKSFKICQLVLSEVKVEIKLTLDELVVWELNIDKWADAKATHDLLPGDVKKAMKELKSD